MNAGPMPAQATERILRAVMIDKTIVRGEFNL